MDPRRPPDTGSYHTDHLVGEPSDRDPEQVAAELRDTLPAALEDAGVDPGDVL